MVPAFDSTALQVSVKEMDDGTTWRVFARVGTARATDADRRAFRVWMDHLFETLERHDRSFCLVYRIPDSFHDPSEIEFLVDCIRPHREAIRRRSTATCIVAPRLVGLFLQAALHLLYDSGTIHVVETTRDAKAICREASRGARVTSEGCAQGTR